MQFSGSIGNNRQHKLGSLIFLVDHRTFLFNMLTMSVWQHEGNLASENSWRDKINLYTELRSDSMYCTCTKYEHNGKQFFLNS